MSKHVEMLSLRSFRLPTLSGHVITFEANVPQRVPFEVVKDAMAAGCVPAQSDDIHVNDAVHSGPVEFQGDLRRSLIVTVMHRLIRDNDPKQFDSGSVPKAEAIAKIAGFTISQQERKAVWEAVLHARSTGDEITTHKDTEAVLDVLDAESRADLLLIAKDQGLDEKAVSGLKAQDLRRKLLARFSGLTPG